MDRPRAPRIDPARLAVALATSRWVPPPVLMGLLRAGVGLLRRRIRQQDRRQDARPPAGEPAVYCIDGYHGGITFWGWLGLPQGGFWYEYCWNLVGRLLIERALARPSLHTVFDVDGHTFEQMARERPQDMARLAQAAQAGAIEVVNGTYGQPLSLTVSGEAVIRHFYYGLRAIEEAIGVRVESFMSQEPLFFPQMPQLLAGFGFHRAVLRTHWAPFGSDPGVDAPVVRWRGPDGSEIPTAPRYAFTDYRWLRPDHRGLEKGGLTGADLARWGRDQLDGLRRRAEMHGVGRPLLSRVADFHVVDPAHPDAPLPNARALAGQGARFLTVDEYFQEAGADRSADTRPEEGETAAWDVDDMPAAIPWGLGAELLLRARTEAEGDLLAAERLDAIGSASGMGSQTARLDAAWKDLLQAQHHDLHVCGPWHSRPHAKSMAEVGADLAWLSAQGGRAVALTALAHLAARVDTSCAGEQPFLVFNPSPWPRREFIPPVGCVVDLPPLGYRTLATAGSETPEEGPLSLEANSDGTFSLLAEGKPLTAGGYLTVWRDGRWHDSRQAVVSVQTLEDGPACRRILVEGCIAGIPFRQWATLRQGVPRLELRLELDLGAETYLGPQLEDGRPGMPYYVDDARKLCLNFATPLRRAVVPSPFLLSESAGERLIGLPGLFLEDDSGGGLAFLNRGTPGYHLDRQAGVLRNVLAWGPRRWLYASDDSLTSGRSRYLALRGRPSYEHAVAPCSSRPEALRAGLDYQLPCLAMAVEASTGPLPPVGSFLSVEPEGVVLSALFGQNGGVYARLWNPFPQEQQASLRVGGEALRLRPVALDLRQEGAPTGIVTLRPWGIQTVRIEGLGKMHEPSIAPGKPLRGGSRTAPKSTRTEPEEEP